MRHNKTKRRDKFIAINCPLCRCGCCVHDDDDVLAAAALFMMIMMPLLLLLMMQMIVAAFSPHPIKMQRPQSKHSASGAQMDAGY